jgi:hypothetical protein
MQSIFSNDIASSTSQYTEKEAKTFTEFSKLTACASKPLNEKCPKCLNPGNGYKFFFFYQTTRINKFNYKFMIHYNDILKRILVTFSGPSVSEHVYIKYIYSAGFSLVKKYNFQIEKEFYEIYFNKLRKILYQKLKKIKSSGRSNFQTYFAGHSIGGSLATLAAFDMQQTKTLENIKVFSLAPMRLGDASYVAMVNSYVTVYRIVKKSDYLVRIPNCYYSTTYKVWRCFNEKIVREFISKPNFPLKIYVNSYLTYYSKANTILQGAIIYARNRLSVRKTQKTQIKKSSRKTKSNKKNALRKLHKKLLLKKEQKKKKALTLKDLMKKLNKKVKSSEKDLKKFNPRKIQKSTRKISDQLKKLNRKDVGKVSFKQLKKLIKRGRKLNGRNLKKKPVILKKKMRAFLGKVKIIAKNIFERANRLLGEEKSIKKRNFKKTQRKNSNKHTRENHHSKRSIKKDNKKNKKTKISPIKKLTKKNETKKDNQKKYIFLPSKFTVYTPFQTYFQFVYYTQPIGYQIFYNDLMTEYTTCQYLNGISLCEKVVDLPLQFTVEGHMTYFGVDFNKC